MPGMVLDSKRAKCPIQILYLFKASSFGKEGAVHNGVCQGRVAVLKERNDGVNGSEVGIAKHANAEGILRKRQFTCFDFLKQGTEASFGEDFQDHFDAQIRLTAFTPSDLR